MANLSSTALEPRILAETQVFPDERPPFWMAALALSMLVIGDIAVVVAALDAIG